MSNQPIGFFDSGIGGLTVLNEVIKLMPCEYTVYFADSKYAPYGEKSAKDILDRCIACTEYLIDQNCKLIVVACNTATTNAIEYLRTHYSVQFIGSEPAVKPAALTSVSKVIGVLATKATLESRTFQNTLAKYHKGVKVIQREGTGLVPLIEQGKENTPEIRVLLEKLLTPMLDAGIDRLVLGCTHYPLLIPIIEKIIGPNVQIISGEVGIAKRAKAVLEEVNLLSSNQQTLEHLFYCNANKTALEQTILKLGIPKAVINELKKIN